VTGKATVTLDELLKFARDTDEALFIFDKDVAGYIREIYVNAVKLRFSHETVEQSRVINQEERERLTSMNTELLIWFGDQYEIARERFSRHIALA
jgi:hypothetical protein